MVKFVRFFKNSVDFGDKMRYNNPDMFIITSLGENMVKRIISVFVMLAAIISLSSCGLITVEEIELQEHERTTEYEKIIDTSAVDVTTRNSESEERYLLAASAIDELGFDTYDGEIVFITEPTGNDLFPEETDTVIKKLSVVRNALVEEKLCVKFVTKKIKADEMLTEAKRKKTAGETQSDILVIPAEKAAVFGTENTLLDLTKISGYSDAYPFIDSSAQAGTSTTSAVYALAGKATFLPESYTAVYMNKELLSGAGIDPEELYILAKNGEWTWDKLISYAEMIDGAGIATPYLESGLCDVVYKSCGMDYIAKTAGKVDTVFTADSVKRFCEIFGRLTKVGVKTQSYSAAAEFVSGETSFLIHKLVALDKIANTESKFGLLPIPCADSGEEYKTLMPKETMMLGISTETHNSKMAYDVIVALNAASDGIIYDGYVSDAFDGKLCDAESAEMLEMILDSGTLESTYILGGKYPEAASASYNFIYRYRNADAKTFEKQRKTATDALNKAIKKAK